MKICIAPTLAGKPWNGATLYQESLGGSEAAVVYIARGLARAGADVTVMSHGEPGKFDGVTYINSSQLGWLIGQQWDAVIVSRWLELLAQPWQANYRVLWLHDLPYQRGMRISCHKVFVISEFQRAAWGLDPAACYLTSDGVDTKVFTPPSGGLAMRDQWKLVWISNPDRGLPVAARIFQEIRKRWPLLELHVYGRASVYGWGPEAEHFYIPQPQFMENVFIHESLSRMQLAAELRTAWAMFYPSFWPETCCMAALEAQASGLPVIAAPLGALPETVKGGILTYDYLNAVSQLRNVNRWEKLSNAGIEFARLRDWDALAGQWLGYIDEQLVRGSSVPGPQDKLSEMVGEKVAT